MQALPLDDFERSREPVLMHGGRGIEPHQRLDVECLHRIDVDADRGLSEHRFDVDLQRNAMVSESPGSDLAKELRRAFGCRKCVGRELAERLL